MNDLQAAALTYARRGWHVFPLHGIVRRRCTCGRLDCSSPGKHPITRHGVKDATSDPHVINEWWRRWRCANIALATGKRSGLIVIDIDLPLALGSLDALVGRVLRTLVSLSGGGGIHLLLGAPEGYLLRNHASRLPGIAADLPGIDLRAEGGYIVAPPSIHRSGRRYEWLDANAAIAPAPEWVKQPERSYVELGGVASVNFDGDGTPYGLAVMRDELDRLRAAQIGTRNHQLNRSTFVLAQLVAGGELLEAAVRAAVIGAALGIGLDEPESRQTIDSAFRAGFSQPRVAPHRLGSS